MKLTELISELQDELEIYGDLPVKVDYINSGKEYEITEVCGDTADGGCFDSECCNSRVITLVIMDLRNERLGHFDDHAGATLCGYSAYNRDLRYRAGTNMILSDRDIRRAQSEVGLLDPFVDENVGPCSVDLTLGDQFIRAGEEWYADQWDIIPGEFMLATTVETVNIPPSMAAQVSGKSSWMRKGLQVCNDAGYIDAGFRGQVTLELKNLGTEPVTIEAGQRICQLVFTQLTSPAQFPYGHDRLGSHYQDQKGTTESRI